MISYNIGQVGFLNYYLAKVSCYKQVPTGEIGHTLITLSHNSLKGSLGATEKVVVL